MKLKDFILLGPSVKEANVILCLLINTVEICVITFPPVKTLTAFHHVRYLPLLLQRLSAAQSKGYLKRRSSEDYMTLR